MTKKTLLVGGLVALTMTAAGGIALAQQSQTPPTRAMRADVDGDTRISQAEFVGQRIQRLTAADTDRDGSVTPEERRAVAQARMAQRADTRFQRIDADHDGAISRAEFDTQRAARMEARPQRAAHAGRMHPAAARMAHRRQGAEGRGPVSIAQVQARTEQAFTRLDADHDGFITTAERQTGRQAMREQRHERMTERRAARQARMQASPGTPASE